MPSARTLAGEIEHAEPRIVAPQDRAALEVVLEAGQGVGKRLEQLLGGI